MERSICIIPARKGSKTIRDKNLIKFNGKTLVHLAVEKAVKSNVFSRIIVTTDYPRHSLGIEEYKTTSNTQLVYNMRPEHLCTDDAKMMDVMQYVLKEFGGSEKWVWLFQPSSPFRSIAEIEHIDRTLKGGNFKSVISFRPVRDYVERSYTLKNGKVYRVAQCNYKNKQDIKNQVTRSGQYYVYERSHIEGGGTSEVTPLYPMFAGGYDYETMTEDERFKAKLYGSNIDAMEDLILAKYAVTSGLVKL